MENSTLTGIEMIAKERKEQIEKHNRTVIKDVAQNSLPTGPFNIKPLLIGAIKCLKVVGGIPWPDTWDKTICEKMDSKPTKERLAIAGAFIAAEIDRLNEIGE